MQMLQSADIHIITRTNPRETHEHPRSPIKRTPLVGSGGSKLGAFTGAVPTRRNSVRSGAYVVRSDVRNGAKVAGSDVWCGAKVARSVARYGEARRHSKSRLLRSNQSNPRGHRRWPLFPFFWAPRRGHYLGQNNQRSSSITTVASRTCTPDFRKKEPRQRKAGFRSLEVPQCGA